MVPLSVWMEQRRHADLTEHAKRLGISRAEFVRRCIEEKMGEIFVPTCDCPNEDGTKMGCTERAIMECYCVRCIREPPEERLYSCRQHQDDVALKHARMRGRPAQFGTIRHDKGG
jgi:hypothetical protein